MTLSKSVARGGKQGYNPFRVVKHLTLQKKFTFLFFIIFFIPFALMTFVSLSMSKGRIEQNTFLHLQNLVEVKETAIEQWLQERIRDGKVLVESLQIKSLDPATIDGFLGFKKELHPAYRDLWVVDRNGKRISKHSQESFRGEEWFQQALEKELFISAPVSSSSSEPPLFTISVLIRDENRRPAGVLKQVVEMSYVADLIFEPHLGKTGKLLLVNSRGDILLHEHQTEVRRQGISKVSYFENLPFEPTRTAVYKDPLGNKVLGSWKWISGLQCYLIAEQDTEEAFHHIHELTRHALVIFTASTAAILFIAFWAMGTVTRPIRMLSQRVASLSMGEFQDIAGSNRRDEIGKLMEGFSEMASKLRKAYGELQGKVKASNTELENAYHLLKQRQEQLIRSDKMAALGQLSAGFAHEIRNPLTSIKIFIQTLEMEFDLNETQRVDFRMILKEIDRLNEMVIRFLAFARPEEPQLQKVDLCKLVGEVSNLLAARMKKNAVHLEILVSPNLPPVKGDPKQLDQVLMNLFLNGIEAMPEGGTLTVSSQIRVSPETREELIQLVIRDTGPGIKPHEKKYLFDPFFTTKEGGTGLGLSIAYTIIQKHNGYLEVESEEGKGTSLLLSLPLPKEA